MQLVSVSSIFSTAHNMDLTFGEKTVEQLQQGLQMRARRSIVCSNYYFFQRVASSRGVMVHGGLLHPISEARIYSLRSEYHATLSLYYNSRLCLFLKNPS
jgi:hypothetical protein